MNTSSAATTTAYSAYGVIIASWLIGAFQSHDWHITIEVITAIMACLVQLGHNLRPLWGALLRKFFGYDPYNGEKEPPPCKSGL